MMNSVIMEMLDIMFDSLEMFSSVFITNRSIILTSAHRKAAVIPNRTPVETIQGFWIEFIYTCWVCVRKLLYRCVV